MPNSALANGPSALAARDAAAVSVTPLVTPLPQLPVALPSASRPLALENTVLPEIPARFQVLAEAGSNLAKLPL